MPRGNYIIQRSCEECGKIFTPPTLVSKYCCPACSKRAYKKKEVAKEKEAIRQALVRRIPSSKGYLTVKESMLIYGISKDVLYRMIRQGLIPSYNFGQRLYALAGSIWMNTSWSIPSKSPELRLSSSSSSQLSSSATFPMRPVVIKSMYGAIFSSESLSNMAIVFFQPD